MRAVVNNAILHLHPVTVPVPALRFTYTWGLGGISVFLGLLLGITGILLMFRYDASVERAYTQHSRTASPGGLRLLDPRCPSLVCQSVGDHRFPALITGIFYRRLQKRARR